MAIVVNIGFLMEGIAHTVTCQVAYDTVAEFLAMFLDGVAYVAHKAEGLSSLHTYFQTFPGYPYQLFLLGRCLTYYKHTRGIGIIAVDNGRKVHVNDVSLFQDILCLGYTMTHHLVDARANTHRERWCLVVTAIVQASGYGIMFIAVAAANLVNFQCRHAGTNILGHLVEHTSVHNTSPTDAFYLLRRLNQIAGRHQLPFVFPVHHLLVEFCRFLSRQAVPPSFLTHLSVVFNFSVPTRNEFPWYIENLFRGHRSSSAPFVYK